MRFNALYPSSTELNTKTLPNRSCFKAEYWGFVCTKSNQVEEIAKQYFTAWNKQDLKALRNLFDKNIVLFYPGGHESLRPPIK